VVADDGVGVGSAVAQEMGHGLGHFLHTLCLGGCRVAQGDEEVNCTCVEKERVDHLLQSGEVCGIKGDEAPSSGVSSVDAPSVGVLQECGACWGRWGDSCWNLVRAFAI
jgi:hypothetical protein